MKRRCASCLSAGLVCLCMLQEAPTPKATVVGAIVTTTVTVSSVSTLQNPFFSVVDQAASRTSPVMTSASATRRPPSSQSRAPARSTRARSAQPKTAASTPGPRSSCPSRQPRLGERRLRPRHRPSAALLARVRFGAVSGRQMRRAAIPLSATSRLMHRSKLNHYSITSSARASSVGGTSRPSALAVFRLITNSNLVGCSTGMSAGFAPRRILSTSSAERRNRSAKFGP